MKSILTLSSAALVAALTPSVSMAATDAHTSSPYYEAEPWYDVTQWFDGDDYRLTQRGEEMLGRDPSYADGSDNADNNRTTTDRPSNYAHTTSPYGYDQRAQTDNWFYDYWDDGYAYHRDRDNDARYEYSATYYDLDGDGFYDVTSILSDRNNDGSYDVADIYTFNNAGESFESDNASDDQKQDRAKRQAVSGEIAKLKDVTVRDTKRKVAQLKTDGSKKVVVDLGPADKLGDAKLKEGAKLEVTGPIVKAGDKQVLLAHTATLDGEEHQLDRHEKTMKVSIEETRTAKVRGREHTLASVTKDDNKFLVDFGPKEKLDTELKQGDQVEIQGVPVAVEDRRMLLVTKLTHDGESTTIDRSTAPLSSSSAAQQGG